MWINKQHKKKKIIVKVIYESIKSNFMNSFLVAQQMNRPLYLEVYSVGHFLV